MRSARPRARYTAAEQQFSVVLQQRLQDLLQGKRDNLVILRRYHREPGRLGVMRAPPSVPREGLRLPVVETLLEATIDFVRLKAAGGPVSQHVARDGSTVELQAFPTKFPHIVLERTDRFVGDELEPHDTTWSLQRLQNQRAQTRINRILDAANLLLDLVRTLR